MQKENQQLIYSPTDLTLYMKSPFASWMDRWGVESPSTIPKQDAVDTLSQSLAQKGLEHEARMLLEFERQGKSVSKVTSAATELALSINDRKKATAEAMRSGAEVIYQAVLETMPFRGFADFLVKRPGKSLLGDYHYEIWDTKLALSIKSQMIVQLCCYSELLENIQGVRPETMTVVLGDRQQQQLITEDYYYYYLSLKERFVNDQQYFALNNMPDPADSRSFGRWSDFAEKLLSERDHLSRVANITRSQIKKLNKAGLLTVDDLVKYDCFSATNAAIGINANVLSGLQAQAQIQQQSDGKIPPLYKVIKPAADDVCGPQAGLALLPPRSDRDVFFDIEGYPIDEGGLEYLWGNSYVDDQGALQFIDFWAHDRQQEKQAFKDFIAWVYPRWQQDPAMHIYHYSHYEVTACRKLMSRYGVCELELDQLLRNEVFVDLYKVVRGSLLIGEPKYSIKNVEHLYRGKRETEVGTGKDSIVIYEQWRQKHSNGTEGDHWQNSETLKSIRDYNIDDCNSTQELTVWLRQQQATYGIDYRPKDFVEEPALTDEITNRTQLRDRLLATAEAEANRSELQQAKLTENMAWMLEFHRREAKPVFWKLFDRMGLSPEELGDDIDCISGCIRTEREAFKPSPRARNLATEYRFDPEQEFKANADSYYVVGMQGDNGKNLAVKLISAECDLPAGLIVVSCSQELPHVITLIPNEYVPPGAIQQAIDSVVAAYEQGLTANTAIEHFLRRLAPKIQGRENKALTLSIVSSDDPAQRLEQIIAAVLKLDNSYLPIQGPPGSGKTFTATRIITELVKQGQRIGISSNSHHAINNLVIGVAMYCAENSIPVTCLCAKNTGEEIADYNIAVVKNAEIIDRLSNGCVVGTTAWGFCRHELTEQFDYLFVDEAGQVAVANLVGMSRSTRNIVLMGDQMQLGQPSQGSHPGESGLSVLDYLLHDSPIIAADMGVFLDTTYRMHSEVNKFISDAIYQGRLQAHPDNDIQQVEVPLSYTGLLDKPAGIQFIPVEHAGNTQSSIEEIELICSLVKELLGRTFIAKDGSKRLIDYEDILFVAPYNHQVSKLKQVLGENARVGSVDKFQGQEAPIVIFSLCASEASESSRGIEFLFDKQRINVAISRAQAMAIVVGNPALFSATASSAQQIKKINVLARLKYILNG